MNCEINKYILYIQRYEGPLYESQKEIQRIEELCGIRIKINLQNSNKIIKGNYFTKN